MRVSFLFFCCSTDKYLVLILCKKLRFFFCSISSKTKKFNFTVHIYIPPLCFLLIRIFETMKTAIVLCSRFIIRVKNANYVSLSSRLIQEIHNNKRKSNYVPYLLILRMPYNSPYQSWSHFDFEYEGIASIQSIFYSFQM